MLLQENLISQDAILISYCFQMAFRNTFFYVSKIDSQTARTFLGQAASDPWRLRPPDPGKCYRNAGTELRTLR